MASVDVGLRLVSTGRGHDQAGIGRSHAPLQFHWEAHRKQRVLQASL